MVSNCIGGGLLGGRGAYSYTASRMPRFQHAVIPRAKIRDYLVSPKNTEGKAGFFKTIGYTTRNADRLIGDIQKGLRDNKALVTKKNDFGRVSIQVTMTLGITRRIEVVTGWCIDPKQKNPRFLTAYPKKGE